jgi:hypothetical protein
LGGKGCNPSILETEIRELRFHAIPGKKICETPHLNGKKLGVSVGPCHPSYGGKCKNKRILVETSLGTK